MEGKKKCGYMPIVAQWEGNPPKMEQNAYTSGTADMVSRTYIPFDAEHVDKKGKVPGFSSPHLPVEVVITRVGKYLAVLMLFHNRPLRCGVKEVKHAYNM